MTSLPNNRYLLSRLQREWTLLSSRRSSVERAATWKLTPRVIGSLDELLVLTGLGPGPIDPSSDETMRKLVAVARHDDLAARVVLQRMLPGLSAIAKRHSDGFDTQLDAFDELLSEALGAGCEARAGVVSNAALGALGGGTVIPPRAPPKSGEREGGRESPRGGERGSG